MACCTAVLLELLYSNTTFEGQHFIKVSIVYSDMDSVGSLNHYLFMLVKEIFKNWLASDVIFHVIYLDKHYFTYMMNAKPSGLFVLTF